jgi:transcription factor 1
MAALRAASLARSLSARLARPPRYSPLRAFSRTAVFYDAPQPGDPPKKRGRPRKIKVEETSPTNGAAVAQTSAASPAEVEADPLDDLVAQAVQIDNELAAEPRTPSKKAKKQDDVEETAESVSVELPPISEWSTHFPSSIANKTRVSIMNPERAKQLAEAFVPAGSKDKVIVEAFPGADLCAPPQEHHPN